MVRTGAVDSLSDRAILKYLLCSILNEKRNLRTPASSSPLQSPQGSVPRSCFGGWLLITLFVTQSSSHFLSVVLFHFWHDISR